MAKQPPRKQASRAWPWDAIELPLHEVQAIKAIPPATLAIIDKICGVGRNPFTSGGAEGQRATDFGCGQMWVGHTLRSIHAMTVPGLGPREQPAGAPSEQPETPGGQQ